jgi:hypothetical protein
VHQIVLLTYAALWFAFVMASVLSADCRSATVSPAGGKPPVGGRVAVGGGPKQMP